MNVNLKVVNSKGRFSFQVVHTNLDRQATVGPGVGLRLPLRVVVHQHMFTIIKQQIFIPMPWRRKQKHKDVECLSIEPTLAQDSLHYMSLSLLLLENFSKHKKLKDFFRAGSGEAAMSDYYGNPWSLQLLVKNRSQAMQKFKTPRWKNLPPADKNGQQVSWGKQ